MKKQTVITIGNFDGLHQGHLSLIKKVVSLKKKYSLKSAVFTFNINTKLYDSLIFSQNQLRSYVKDFNIDYFINADFMKDIKGLSCEDFVKLYLYEMLNAKYVVVGENFFFGKARSGNAQTLKEIGEKYNIKTIIMPSRKYKKDTLSSTRIRAMLKDGKVLEANRLMYKSFSISGIVKKGYHIGTDVLNIPTANIAFPDKCIAIKNGVYITVTTVDGKKMPSITNVGLNPTNPKKEVTVETNILGFSGDIYKKRIKVEFLKYIRNEMAFSSQKMLKKQIEKDIETAKKFFLKNERHLYET